MWMRNERRSFPIAEVFALLPSEGLAASRNDLILARMHDGIPYPASDLLSLVLR